jgi:hypothetical protein
VNDYRLAESSALHPIPLTYSRDFDKGLPTGRVGSIDPNWKSQQGEEYMPE